ncbi:MAG: Nif3-like dinuclear metal center hexameric protein [Euzebya sp.]
MARLYPHRDAEGFDQVGLHIGDPDHDRVSGVLVSLDVTQAVLDEAREVGANLIIAHHPLLFSPLQRLTPTTASGRLALMAVRQGCAVLAAHTNVDKAADGTSYPAARLLGLTDLRPIRPVLPDPAEELVKIVTFVPGAHTEAVIRAMATHGAGVIGDYTECAFTQPGTGRFRPGAGTTPAIGSPGEPQQVAEDRVEMVLRRKHMDAVLNHLRDIHPYEEVPCDLYPLITAAPPPSRGLGLIGTLPRPLTLAAIARTLATGLPASHLRLATEDPDRQVRTVAVCGGAGDSLIRDLLGADGKPTVDVFITGDLKHHPVLDALCMGLSLIDAGHFATENPAMDDVVTNLEHHREWLELTAPIHRSTIATDPWVGWDTDHR